MGATVERLGVQVRARGAGPDPRVLLGLALRNNPRRAQLLVSRVLGKHVPTDPRVVHAAGLLLGALVADALAARPPRALPVDLLHAAVRGAPGAAAGVARRRRGRRSRPTRSTPSCSGSPRRPRRSGTASRRPSAARTTCTPRGVRWRASPPRAAFVEEHSHHTGHLLLPSDPAAPGRAAPAGAGRRRALHRPHRRQHDHGAAPRRSARALRAGHAGRPPRGRARRAARRGAGGRRGADPGVPHAAARPRRAGRGPARRAGGRDRCCPTGCRRRPSPPGRLRRRRSGHRLRDPRRASMPSAHTQQEQARPPGYSSSDLGWPAGLPAGARHGFTAAHHRLLAVALPELAADLARRGRRAGRRAHAGARHRGADGRAAAAGRGAGRRRATTSGSPPPRAPPRSSSTSPTTPSPAASPSRRTTTPPTAPGPASPTTCARALGPRAGGGRPARPTHPPCAPGSSRAGPAHPAHHRGGHAVSTPEPLRGPAFGSYPPDEVAWLLTDLSDVALEAPTEEREEAVQSGGAHYAESLPHEYQPDAAYLRLYHEALAASAGRLAQAVGVVAELVLAERGPDVVLGVAGQGGHPGRRPAAPLGRGPARAHAAALRRVDRPRPRHRRRRPPPPGRAPRPRARRVRRRLDRQGRDQPRAGGGAARAPRSPPSWRCSPTPAGARARSARARTGSSPPPASTRRCPGWCRAPSSTTG